jgi:hypothetical protein
MLGKMAEVELSLVWGFRYTPTLLIRIESNLAKVRFDSIRAER